MSIWSDIHKRSCGKQKRKEDIDIREEWIKQYMAINPENEFRKLYQDDIFIVDHIDIVDSQKPIKSFEPISITWRDKLDIKNWKL